MAQNFQNTLYSTKPPSPSAFRTKRETLYLDLQILLNTRILITSTWKIPMNNDLGINFLALETCLIPERALGQRSSSYNFSAVNVIICWIKKWLMEKVVSFAYCNSVWLSTNPGHTWRFCHHRTPRSHPLKTVAQYIAIKSSPSLLQMARIVRWSNGQLCTLLFKLIF